MKVAFIFPGQGAQYVGMGKDLYSHFDIIRKFFDKTNQILKEEFVDLIFYGDEEDIKKTENTQPGILMVSTAISELLKNEGIYPVITAGLSLGEYSALVAAKSISYEDAIPLVRKRGILMNEAYPPGKGTMAAVLGLEAEKLLTCCKKAAEYGVVTIANYNCPGQLVISGQVEAVEAASQLAKEAGAKRVIPLQVSGPFHTSLLQPAGEALYEELKKVSIKEPEIPVISNVTAKPAGSCEEIRELLALQVSHPVLLENSIRYMLSQGVDTFIEVGPGKALTGFVQRIDKKVSVYNINNVASLEFVLNLLLL
ncbi:MAG: ACP S-malonyltransferase [Clostridiales bacterium]|jgi:[acyl-carrier-protein] S-malonyltransferase|nr:ACP S-malonyltransferase [Clostridiales bacterium]